MEKKIRLLDKTFKTFIPNEKIERAIDKVAEKIGRDYAGSTDIPVFLCILNGALMFTAELMKRLNFNMELVSMKLSSYSGTSSTGVVRKVMGLSGSLKGKRVLVIEDIVDTGSTIEDIEKICREEGATEVKICTMLLKPEVYRKNTKIDYVAMEIPNDFIVGFGLDYNEIGRNLPDIYVIDGQ
jgi:hypoxanthine phosphoribosyltransferase